MKKHIMDINGSGWIYMSNRIYVFGDLHGSYKPVRDFYNRYKDNPDFNFDGTDTIILLGDAGLNYYFNYRDDNFKNALCKYPFKYFVIRGNHEERPSICMEKEPEKWTMEEFWGNKVYVEKKYPKIKYALDKVTEYEIVLNNKTYYTLVIPGAYSIDKEYRQMMKYSWFPQEQLSFTEKLDGAFYLSNVYDLVLSHTAPLKYERVELFLPMLDQSKVDKSMEEYLDWIDDHIYYNLWIWAHYHDYKYYDPKKWDEFNRRKLMLFQKEQIDLGEWLNTEGEGKVL